MNVASRARVRATIEPRCAEIVDRWYAAIARTSFSPRPAAEVRAELTTLAQQAIDALLDEQLDRSRAQLIGATLAELHYIQPEALAGTLDVLGRELLAGLAPAQARALYPRLTALLGAVAAGFYARGRAMILQEQDEVRRALLDAREQAEAAEDARRLAEAAVRVRTDVLNTAAHDLRSPITVILGHADLLHARLGRETPPSPVWVRSQAASIRAGALRIRAMVEELLDVARLQQGQALELDIGPVDVGALVRDVARGRGESIQGAPPVLVRTAPNVVVPGDQARLERVVENLLANAIKYSPRGTPVELEVEALQGARGALIQVRDQGVGIPADELPQLFTPFFRASTAQGIPGIGIGLAGSKAIVEQHGGHISIDSAVGAGTTVCVTLPGMLSETEEPGVSIEG